MAQSEMPVGEPDVYVSEPELEVPLLPTNIYLLTVYLVGATNSRCLRTGEVHSGSAENTPAPGLALSQPSRKTSVSSL